MDREDKMFMLGIAESMVRFNHDEQAKCRETPYLCGSAVEAQRYSAYWSAKAISYRMELLEVLK